MDHQASKLPCRSRKRRPKGLRGFILAEHTPLPDGIEEGDAGVFVIRLAAPTREDMGAARDAY